VLAESSSAIDREVRSSLAGAEPLHLLDEALVRELRPDLIITQDQCDVCVPPASQLDVLMTSWEGQPPALHIFAPATLKQILDGALRLSRAVGRADASMRWIAEAEGCLQKVRTNLGLHRRMDEDTLPSAVCIEWLDPIMTAGHWVPDVVSMSGGRTLLADKGARSEYVPWETIRQADPDILLVAPCGFSIEQTRRELHVLTEREGWADLRSVRTGNVYLLDGNAYLNLPGPRIYRTIELVAAALRGGGEAFHWLQVKDWEIEKLTG
jgi:iron complex transport system substrate-binding protein